VECSHCGRLISGEVIRQEGARLMNAARKNKLGGFGQAALEGIEHQRLPTASNIFA
jgi:hypothetical protein